MKKIKKSALAVSMACVLAMGAVPAFAADAGDEGAVLGDDGTGNKVIEGAQWTDSVVTPTTGNTASAKTEVGVFSQMGQIRVSVPTNVAMALTAAGGTMVGPSARTDASADATTDQENGPFQRLGTGYGIENLSGMKLKVSNVAGATKTGFKFATAAQTSTSRKPTGNDIANLYVTLTPTTGTAVAGLAASGNTTNWTIDNAVDENTPTVLGITLGGSNSPLNGQVGTDAVSATGAFDITYTIGLA